MKTITKQKAVRPPKEKLAKLKKFLTEYSNKCKSCGYHIHYSEVYCGECLCDDIYGY